MKINQVSSGSGQTSQQALINIAVAEFAAAFPLSNYAEFYQMVGNADAPPMSDADIIGGDTRTISGEYITKSGEPGFGAVILKIYGDQIETDVAYKRRSTNRSIKDRRLADLTKFAQSLGRNFMDAVINDEIDAEHFSGLYEQAVALSRQIPWDSVSDGTIPPGTDPDNVYQQDMFLEKLRAAMGSIPGGPSCLIMNADMIARFESIGRHYLAVSNVQDIYGKNQQVLNFKGVPIIDAGYQANNSDYVIPNDESVGESSDCTSIYIVKFGEEQDVTFATNCGLDVQDMGLVKTKWTTLCEMDVDLCVLNPKSLYQLCGIRLNPST